MQPESSIAMKSWSLSKVSVSVDWNQRVLKWFCFFVICPYVALVIQDVTAKKNDPYPVDDPGVDRSPVPHIDSSDFERYAW